MEIWKKLSSFDGKFWWKKKKSSAGLAWKLLHSTLLETWKKISRFDGKFWWKKKSSAGLAWKLLHSTRCQIDDYGLGLTLSNNCK